MTDQRTKARRAIAVVLGAMLALSLAAGATAHENREVDEFTFVVGFMNEPAYVNELNGIDLRITRTAENGHEDEDEEADDHGDESDAVENAHETLQAAIIYGEETMEVELRPVWGQPGAYTADVIPTATGAYTFQFIGEIEGVEINETFRSGPDTFSEVADRDALQFPSDPPSPADETDQAAAFGLAGVAAGLLGLLVGGAAYFKASNSAPQQRSDASSRQSRRANE